MNDKSWRSVYYSEYGSGDQSSPDLKLGVEVPAFYLYRYNNSHVLRELRGERQPSGA
jgi:hypothetical protein